MRKRSSKKSLFLKAKEGHGLGSGKIKIKLVDPREGSGTRGNNVLNFIN
jgi:hypothetical protein